jgi:hypothetical protein
VIIRPAKTFNPKAALAQFPVVEVTEIVLSHSSATLMAGEALALQATVSPSYATNPMVTWSTSDASVAIVVRGVVTAVSPGTATITAKAGDKTAECVVTVTADAFYDVLGIADYGVYVRGTGDLIPGTDTVIDLSIGETKCALTYVAAYYAWDENITFDSQNGAFLGDGIVFALQNFPMYVVNDENFPQYAGVAIDMGFFAAMPLAEGEVTPLCGNSGNIDAQAYGDWVQLLYNAADDITQEEVDAVRTAAMANTTGALMLFGEDWGYDLYIGAVNKLYYESSYTNKETGEEYPALFAADVTWANVTAEDRLYGFKVDMDHYESTFVEGEGGEILFVKPYEYSTIHRVFDVNGIFDGLQEEPAEVSVRTPKLMNNSYRLEKYPTFNGKSLDNKTLHMAK